MKFVGISPLWMLVIVLAVSQTGNSLKCFVCNSAHNESCLYLEDEKYLVDCSSINERDDMNYTTCRTEKLSLSLSALNLTTTRTIRSCGYEKHEKYECYVSSNPEIDAETCECVEDGCNTAQSLDAIKIPFFLTLMFALVTANTLLT